MNPYVILIGSQLIFSASDLLARSRMSHYGFKLSTFISLWFLVFILLRIIATAGQLYIFSQFELGKTLALFAAASIVLANILGLLLLKEYLGIKEYIGVMLAVSAFLVMSLFTK